MNNKEKIATLRLEGKTHKQILEITGLSRGTVSYYENQTKGKEKNRIQNAQRKFALVAIKQESGGQCSICGYDKCLAALDFHHVDDTIKIDSVRNLLIKKSKRLAVAEAAKCILLCANCHREFHDAKRPEKSTNIKSSNQTRNSFVLTLKYSMGGKCAHCGYSDCLAALDFHHENKDDKNGLVSSIIYKHGRKAAKEEAAKCILLCANCHREFHYLQDERIERS